MSEHATLVHRDEIATKVRQFGIVMRYKLRKNEHKTHWSHFSAQWLLHRLRQEVGELERALENGADPVAIRDEAADVANFALMIADVAAPIPTNYRAPRISQW